MNGTGRFLGGAELEPELFHDISVTWLSRPALTGAAQILMLDASLGPGRFHTFHYHPQQEEILYVLEGWVEQWVGEEKRRLSAGEAVFIPPGVIHAAANISDARARIIAVTSPCVGETGHDMVDVGAEEPWASRAAVYSQR